MRVLPALLLLSLLPAGVSAAAAQPRSIGDIGPNVFSRLKACGTF